MNEFKGTPGPWRHCSASDGKCKCGLIWGPDEKATVATVNVIECDVQDHGWAATHAEEIRLANIALICASPDLLAACEKLLRHVTDGTIMCGIVEGMNLDKTRDEARAAIAKARGQTA